MTRTTRKRSAPRPSGAKRRAGRNDWERREQVALFRWAAMHAHQYPELRLMFAVPNGMAARSPITVRKMKAEGLRPGVPDIWLPVASAGCHGLAIELKVPPNDLTDEQAWWAGELRQRGWRVEAPCWGFEHARAVIGMYLWDDGPILSPAIYREQLQRRYGILRSRA